MGTKCCPKIFILPKISRWAEMLSWQVGSGDEGLSLFSFDLSSAEADTWWLEDEQYFRVSYDILC